MNSWLKILNLWALLVTQATIIRKWVNTKTKIFVKVEYKFDKNKMKVVSTKSTSSRMTMTTYMKIDPCYQVASQCYNCQWLNIKILYLLRKQIKRFLLINHIKALWITNNYRKSNQSKDQWRKMCWTNLRTCWRNLNLPKTPK